MVEFEVPIYGGTVKVFANRAEFDKEYEKQEGEHCEFTECKGLTCVVSEPEDNDIVYMIGVFDNDVSTLVHECAHLAIFVAEHTGWDICETTSEPFCYLLGNLFDLSLPAIR